MTTEDFSDIEMIRKKYMNIFNPLQDSSIKQTPDRRGITAKFDGSASSKKKTSVVEASIDNLLNTLKSSKKHIKF